MGCIDKFYKGLVASCRHLVLDIFPGGREQRRRIENESRRANGNHGFSKPEKHLLWGNDTTGCVQQRARRDSNALLQRPRAKYQKHWSDKTIDEREETRKMPAERRQKKEKGEKEKDVVVAVPWPGTWDLG